MSPRAGEAHRRGLLGPLRSASLPAVLAVLRASRRPARRAAAVAAGLALVLSAWLTSVAHVHHADEAGAYRTAESAPCGTDHLHRVPADTADECFACLARAGTHALAALAPTPWTPHHAATRLLQPADAARSVARVRALGPRGPPRA